MVDREQLHSHYAVLQFHGGRYTGWQRQREERTVQGEVEAALARLAGGPVTAHAAGRTDAGVHALGLMVSFVLPRPWAPEELRRALNATTPRDIWIWRAGPAPPGFHARKDALARRYRYVVGCDDGARSPFRREFEWALGVPLDGSLLNEAAAVFRGTHDFRAFAAVGQDKPHYRCAIREARWQERDGGEGFIFTVESDRFLHRMVRFLVGGMVDVARGRRPLDDLRRLLRQTSNHEASPPAPPEGLYFVCARYPNIDLGHAHEILPRHGPHR